MYGWKYNYFKKLNHILLQTIFFGGLIDIWFYRETVVIIHNILVLMGLTQSKLHCHMGPFGAAGMCFDIFAIYDEVLWRRAIIKNTISNLYTANWRDVSNARPYPCTTNQSKMLFFLTCRPPVCVWTQFMHCWFNRLLPEMFWRLLSEKVAPETQDGFHKNVHMSCLLHLKWLRPDRARRQTARELPRAERYMHTVMRFSGAHPKQCASSHICRKAT